MAEANSQRPMSSFEREVIDRLGRIETKVDADFRVLYGNGKPGLIKEVSDLCARILRIEESHTTEESTVGKHAGIVAWIISTIIAVAAVIVAILK